MRKLFVSDIFGATPALNKLAFSNYANATVVSPYSKGTPTFSNEQQAYNYFTSHVGIKEYAKILTRKINTFNEAVVLIGFSVGASAIWMVSESLAHNQVHSAYCYYGSQIRHAADVNPRFPVHLLFPQTERHFSVKEVIHSVENKHYVMTTQLQYLHGFMNPHSINFNPTGYEKEIGRLSRL